MAKKICLYLSDRSIEMLEHIKKETNLSLREILEIAILEDENKETVEKAINHKLLRLFTVKKEKKDDKKTQMGNTRRSSPKPSKEQEENLFVMYRQEKR